LPRIEQLPDGATRVTARLAVDELEELFGVKLEAEDDGVETVGGLLAQALGRVPIPGAATRVGPLELTAEGARGRRNRIATVVVRNVETPMRAGDGRGELTAPDVVVDTVEAAQTTAAEHGRREATGG
jgi:CBS domain containing-hemolysin-like protein